MSKIKLHDQKISVDKYTFSFSTEVKGQICAQFDKYRKNSNEVGGYLFADEKLDNSFHFVWASKPGPLDRFRPTSYKLSLKKENRDLKKYCKDRRYMAVWHSHREYGTDPSSTDVDNLKNVIKDTREDICLSLIFNTTEINVIAIIKKGGNKYNIYSKKIKRGDWW